MAVRSELTENQQNLVYAIKYVVAQAIVTTTYGLIDAGVPMFDASDTIEQAVSEVLDLGATATLRELDEIGVSHR